MLEKGESRRKFLQTAAVAAGVTIAGCTGGGGGDREEMTLRVGTSTGGTADVGAAVERAVSEESDELTYSTVESSGYIGTAQRLNEDQFNAGIVDNTTLTKAQAEEGDFEDEPLEQIPYQGFYAFPYNIYLVAREDTDIETFDDLAGATVYPAEPGFSTRATTLDVWSQDPTADVYDEMEIRDLGVSDAPGALEEGEIDAAIAYGTPGAGHTGWVTEYDARVDVRYVEPTDALRESIDAYAGASAETIDVEEMNWEQDIGVDEVETWALKVQYVFHPEDASEDAVYELCRVVHEHNDTVREGDEQFIPVESAEDLTGAALEDVPFHPGAAKYYEENDAWNDDWEIGD
ncbi:TAXI family TRAP transporter solute-binding subunit [Natrialbaceae archaeon GCM10025810]|uniref:TAXI family TRAP transporter solute-binding subunit n=1 Tax=Halovalidus salilacus TaxID=3075124 RepID=UPI00360D5956